MLAEPGSLLVSEDTYRLVANDVTAREMGPVLARRDLDPKGFDAPLEQARAGVSRSGEAAVRLQRAIAISGGSDEGWVQAVEDFERAIELFGDIEALPDQARAVHAYANALEAVGHDPESRAQLTRALQMFESTGISPDA